jgi:two-component system response regulator ChvI
MMMASQDIAKASPVVFFVERNEEYRNELALELTQHGFLVRHFSDGQELMRAPSDVMQADLLLLDWQLSDISGMALMSEVRRRRFNRPVVFLTWRSGVDCENLALEHGASDFICKSRGPQIVAKRLLRAVHSAALSRGADGDWSPTQNLVLDCQRSRGCWNGTDLNLTSSEFRIVVLLAHNAGAFLPYDVLYHAQRRGGFAPKKGKRSYPTNVRASIMRLRKKFRKVDVSFDEIERYVGFGYRWRQPNK